MDLCLYEHQPCATTWLCMLRWCTGTWTPQWTWDRATGWLSKPPSQSFAFLGLIFPICKRKTTTLCEGKKSLLYQPGDKIHLVLHQKRKSAPRGRSVSTGLSLQPRLRLDPPPWNKQLSPCHDPRESYSPPTWQSLQHPHAEPEEPGALPLPGDDQAVWPELNSTGTRACLTAGPTPPVCGTPELESNRCL